MSCLPPLFLPSPLAEFSMVHEPPWTTGTRINSRDGGTLKTRRKAVRPGLLGKEKYTRSTCSPSTGAASMEECGQNKTEKLGRGEIFLGHTLASNQPLSDHTITQTCPPPPWLLSALSPEVFWYCYSKQQFHLRLSAKETMLTQV